MWDVSSGQCVTSFEGHTRAVNGVCWIDDDTVASCSNDGHMKVGNNRVWCVVCQYFIYV